MFHFHAYLCHNIVLNHDFKVLKVLQWGQGQRQDNLKIFARNLYIL